MTRSGPARRPLAVLLLLISALALTAGGWPTYLHDPARSADGSGGKALTPASAGRLSQLWSFPTGRTVAASPAVVGDTVYVGSWNGYEYALDEATGKLKWKTFLGITKICDNPPLLAGVTSSATVEDGTVYLGGGDANWYALSAANGHVLWSVPTGDNSAAGGHYNWSSPLIYRGYAYIGVASGGDCPMIRGALLKVSLQTHRIVDTWNVVHAGHVGGGIWTSPTVDPSTNTIYVTTGNSQNPENPCDDPLAPSIVALDATTLAVKDQWQIPWGQLSADGDWGTTPTLLHDGVGNALVAAAGKNGYLYAFRRGQLAAGPVWQDSIAVGGDCPECGEGSISSTTFDGQTLYAGGGTTTIDGAVFPGSVRAIDPASGHFLWQHPAPGAVIPALAYTDGLVVDGAGSFLEVLNAKTGALLFRFATAGPILSAPSVSNGHIFVGSSDGKIYALGVPSSLRIVKPRGKGHVSLAVLRSNAPLAPLYDTAAQPTIFVTSAPEMYNVTLTNTGTTAWRAGGADAVRLAIRTAPEIEQPNMAEPVPAWITDQRFNLPFDIPPNGTVTLAVTVTPPQSPGAYVVDYDLLRGVSEWIPQHVQQDVSVISVTPSFQIDGQPSSFPACGTAAYRVTVTNAGTSTWPGAGPEPLVLSVHFAPRGGGAPQVYPWTANTYYYLGQDVTPGQSVALSVLVRAPAVPGSYVLEYQLWLVNNVFVPRFVDSTIDVMAASDESSTRSTRVG